MEKYMRTLIGKTLLASALLCTACLSQAAPRPLTDLQMDQISAGGQYSIVAGGGTADVGTVDVQANSQSIEKANGATVTKAKLKVVALGSGLDAYGGGESAADGAVSSVYDDASVDQGKIVIKVKTMSKVKANGEVVTKSKIKVKVVERNVRIAGTQSTATF